MELINLSSDIIRNILNSEYINFSKYWNTSIWYRIDDAIKRPINVIVYNKIKFLEGRL